MYLEQSVTYVPGLYPNSIRLAYAADGLGRHGSCKGARFARGTHRATLHLRLIRGPLDWQATSTHEGRSETDGGSDTRKTEEGGRRGAEPRH